MGIDREDLVLIGKITGAHGIKGTLKLYSYAESPSIFKPGDSVFIWDEEGLRPLEVAGARPKKNIVLISFAGIDTRNEAETYKGKAVYIKKESLPPLEDDTYYWSDIIGLNVFTRTGEYLGSVKEIIPTGSNDVYVVKSGGEPGAKEILVPALSWVVIQIDLANRKMTVELPPGLE